MAFVGIPLIFVLISVFEMSRGMWMYHTCSYAVKNGVRYAITHGINCNPTASSTNPNSCSVTLAQVAAVIQQASVGLELGATQLTFVPGTSSSSGYDCFLSSPGAPLCSSQTTTAWPPDTAGSGALNGTGKPIQITIRTPFHSALSMFWPGSKPVSFALAYLAASSKDYITF